MSYQVETFKDGAWADTSGLVFETAEEAAAYGRHVRPMGGARTTPSDYPVNYRWKDGRLVPGAAPPSVLTPGGWEKMWADMHKIGGGGIVWEDIYGNRSSEIAQALLQSMHQTVEEAIGKAYERAFMWGGLTP